MLLINTIEDALIGLPANLFYDISNLNHVQIFERLQELSWSGKTIRDYRNAGVGFENVLTAEVFQALVFLPREIFLGEIIRKTHSGGDINDLIDTLIDEVENLNFKLLHGNIYLKPSADTHMTKYAVQPDGIIETKNIYCVLEAKRIKRSCFRDVQLAREFVAVLRESKNKKPLLLLVLGKKPPVSVCGQGRKSIKEAIIDELANTMEITENFSMNYSEVIQMIDQSVVWITWEEINDIVIKQLKSFNCESQSVKASVTRLVDEVIIPRQKRHLFMN